jgi:DNA-binding transcriptional LysR family regulator
LLQYLIGMELRQLRYLVALADELSFTRAARRANVAQPALSRQIARLEAELGVPLVTRTTRQVMLTPAGARLVERARRALDEIDAAAADVRRAAGLVEGSVTIGVTPTPGALDVSALLIGFHRRHPDVELAVREALSVELVELLRTDRLDLAFVTTPPPNRPPRLEARRVTSEELVVIVARGHRLARRARVRLAELRDEPFVSFPPGATIRRQLFAAAATAGFEPRVSFETGQVARVRALVSRGLGVAVLPAADAQEPGWPVRTVALDAPPLRHEVFLAWRAGRPHPPAPSAFLAHAQRQLARAGPPSATA